MNAAQSTRVVVPLYATTVATNATQTVVIDLDQFDYASVEVLTNPATATNSSTRPSACLIAFGDTTVYTNATTAARFVGGTQTSATVGYVLPVHNNTSNPYTVKFGVDRGRLNGARYLFAAVTPAASHTTTTIRAELYKGDIAATADSTASRNVNVSVNG